MSRICDALRNRKGNGPHNLALLRRMALNLARSNPRRARRAASSSGPTDRTASSSNWSGWSPGSTEHFNAIALPQPRENLESWSVHLYGVP